MKLLVALVCVSLVAANVVKSKEQQVLEELRNRQIPKEAEALKGQALADYLNKNQNYFKAKVATRKFLNGVKRVSLPEDVAKNAVTHAEIPDDVIPDSFDSRTAWPQCPSIGNIRDQSACGSCWAFGAAEAISDRTCIASNGDLKLTLSADDIMTCCGMFCGDGCEGGYPIEAWKWWVQTGIVTGGSHEDLTGCKPYPFNECEHHTNATHYQPCPSSIYPTPTCDKSCQAGYDISYSADKHYGKSAYGISSSVASIQKEILTNGPVEVAFDVYADFEQYYGGIYVHKAGSYLGGHAVKAIGWGSENGVPYWLIANSWNTDWGENGYFRIVRGLDECGIESGVVGGLPKL